MNNKFYIALTIVLVLVYPAVQYWYKSQKCKRILYFIYIPFALFYIVVTVFQVKSSTDMESMLVHIRDYSSVAQLDALGQPPNMGINSDVKVKNKLTMLLEGTYSIANGQIFMKRDSKVEQRYRSIIEEYPNFPFGYYYLALCLRERGDDEWRLHAQYAVGILKCTIQIDGHSKNHDEVLNKIYDTRQKQEKFPDIHG